MFYTEFGANKRLLVSVDMNGEAKRTHASGELTTIYEVSPDESAILGEAQGVPSQAQGRIFEAHSFSGHGAMHSPATGLALAEKMLHGKYSTIDAEPLSARRFIEDGPLLHEGMVI
jgi:sarcosine oxidase subunit beta